MPVTLIPWAGACASFAAVALAMPLVIRWARRSGFLDEPGGRKKHDDAIPPVGGLVLFPVFVLCLFGTGQAYDVLWPLAALTVLMVTGALDDRFHLPARLKFVIQFAAAFMLVVPGGIRVATLGDLFGFGYLWMGWMSIPFSVIATVLLINAVNLMDGLDGLAGGIGIIALSWLTVCGYLTGQGAGREMILIGALAGFLLYNLRRPGRMRASVFLGDAGALALGLALAWFAIDLSQDPGEVIAPIGVAWILALPIYDTCGQFARRVSQGRHPFDADHHHFHHHFLYAGLSHGRAVAVILAISFFMGLIGAAGSFAGVPEWIMTALWTVLLFAHIYMSMRPHRYRRLLLRLTGGEATAERQPE